MKTFANPKRSLGQNFLVSPHFQKQIVAAVKNQYHGQVVVEIGPGRGALTEHFLTFSQKLLLIEKDNALAKDWQERLVGDTNKTVLCCDARDWDFAELAGQKPALVVGNLPYNVATEILLIFLKQPQRFSALIFMIQKEVAEKCVATPHHKNYGPLSVACQLLSDIQKICDVPPQAFKPKPNVDSRVLCFIPKSNPVVQNVDEFLDFVKVIFSSRRKIIKGLLAKSKYGLSDILEGSEVLGKRAEELGLAEMVDLYQKNQRM